MSFSRAVSLSLLVLGVAAFEPEFYRLLESGYRSSPWSELAGGRVVRETKEHHRGGWHGPPGPGRNIFAKLRCCGDEGIMDYEAMKKKHELAKICIEEVVHNNTTDSEEDPFVDHYSCEKLKKIKTMHICLAECMMKKVDSLNDDGSINAEKVIEFSNDIITEDWMKGLAKTAIEKCAAVKDFEIKDEEAEAKCNPQPINFKNCIWKELVTTCPEEHQLKNPMCDRLRERLQKKA